MYGPAVSAVLVATKPEALRLLPTGASTLRVDSRIRLIRILDQEQKKSLGEVSSLLPSTKLI